MNKKMLKKFAPIKAFLALNNAAKEYSVRDLAKAAGIGIGTSKQCLDWLLAKEIVKRKVIGKTYQHSLNVDNILTRYAKILVSLNDIQESGIIKELLDFPIISVVLYGSVARGDDSPASDIDLLVIAGKEIKIKSMHFGKNLKREVTIICNTLPEWRRKAKEDKPFYDRVIIEGIPLYGELPVVR